MFKRLWLLLLCLGCRSTALEPSNHGTIASSTAAGLPCGPTTPASAPYHNYFKAQLAILFASNAETFQGRFAPERFCVVTVDSTAIGAGNSNDGRLFLKTGLLKATETDAQVAAVLAHELAHITLRHETMDFDAFVEANPAYAAPLQDWRTQNPPIRRYDQLAHPTPEWNTYIAKLRTLVRSRWEREKTSPLMQKGRDCPTIQSWAPRESWRLDRDLPSQDYEVSLCYQFFQELTAEARAKRLLWTWKETEADRTGFGYFLRTGYPQDEYSQFFSNAHNFARIEPSLCDTDIANVDRHYDCWRSIDIRPDLREYAKHNTRQLELKNHNLGEQLQNLRRPLLSR